jgi:hypothetical protein
MVMKEYESGSKLNMVRVRWEVYWRQRGVSAHGELE